MQSKVLSFALSLSLSIVGIAFFNGGFTSRKHGIFVSAGNYNEVVGIALIVLAAYFFYLGFLRKMPTKKN